MRVQNLVLLVEDDAPLKRSLEKFLNQAGYAFDSCSTAREALALAEKLRHDVVIVEYHLPDANGSSFLEKLMLLAPKTAAIVLSEYDFQAIANDLDRVKIEFYLKKPFDLVEFESALSSACSKASKPIRNGNRQSNLSIKGLPASIPMQGTLRDGDSR
ncbi:MAG: response regulator [Syntrophobacteraceae bacterium]